MKLREPSPDAQREVADALQASVEDIHGLDSREMK
jgi:hypothetical protein